MTVLLGGRVAEQIVFGAVTTGASDDLKRVAEIAHSMVHDYAMGNAGVGRSPDGDVRLSETTLRIRDEERQDLIEEARSAARRLIVAHRAELDALAARAARARGARPRGDRPDHGRRPAPGARARRRAARRRLASPTARSADGDGGWRGVATQIDCGGVRPHRPHRRRRRGARGRARAVPATASASTSPTARSSRSRASRPCCSTSARTTSSCSRRSARTRRSASSSPARGPGLHHVAYQVSRHRGRRSRRSSARARS